MNRNYNLKLDLQFRCNNSTMKFNQFDNNTSDFFIRITNGGKLFDIEKAIVVLAVIKPNKEVDSQFVEVENGVVYANLKPSMKDEIGIYTARAMLILEDERVVTDVISYEVEEDKIFSLLNDTVETTEEFTLLTDMLSRLSNIETNEEQRMINEAERILSEENRKIEEAKRVEAELVRQHEEADRAKYDATRESNENIRKQNESIRLANETNRIDEEAKRVEEENKRKLAEEERNANYNFMTEDEERRRLEANAHKEAEALRVQAEANRVNEEAKRRTTEQARVSAENTRVSNENTREANEVTRQTNETQRVEAETQRQNRYNSFITDAEANANNFENYTNTAKVKEEERKSNELDRKSQEDRRVFNEVERISNENTRKANEVAREKNETSRQYVFENKVDEIDKKIIELNTTKDNFVSSVNTKVDNKISELDNAKSDMTTTVSNKVDEVETRFNALTSSQQQSSEVIDARDGETSLKARLDRDIEKAKQVYVNVEGSHISTDSTIGYLKDVEILGNTIQSASNLADIRSVGEKVEGQELYEIPVLSCGKNLYNGTVHIGKIWNIATVGTPLTDETLQNSSDCNATDIFCIKPSTKYIAHLDRETLSGNIKFYDKDKKYISQVYTLPTISPNNAYYCTIHYNNSTYGNGNAIQLEEGTVATPYEPYQEDKITILSPTPLEKVGDVRDRIIEKDGVWEVEKNVKTVVLNGNENWIKNPETETHFKAYANNILPTLKTTNILSNSDDITSVYKDFGGGVNVSVLKSELSTPDLDGFKKYVKNKGYIIKYLTTQPTFIPLPHSQQVKLRTFANKTNISFGCEIEGTIKAQVPKSLGATVNTHTEQISNLNKELDRVKKLEESTVSTVTTESDFTTVEATSNGYFEDVKLEGKTLVNLYENKAKLFNASYIYSNNEVLDFSLLKPNSMYTLIVLGNDKVTQTSICNTSATQYFYIRKVGKITTFTTPSSFDSFTESIRVYAYSNSSNPFIEGDEQKIKFLILEGDHTQNPPSYFEGLKSVGDGTDEIVVSSVKGDGNLFNKDEPISLFSSTNNNYNKYLEVNGDYIVNKYGAYGMTTYISTNVKQLLKGTYTLSCECYIGSQDAGKSVSLGCRITDNNKLYKTINLDTYSTWHKISYTFHIDADTNIDGLMLQCGGTSTNFQNIDCRFRNIQLEKNDTCTDYKDIKQDKKRLLFYNNETQTWEKPILREWDSIEKHADGKYYYHVRSKEGDYVEGDESLNDCITDLTVSVKKLAEEKVYECTNIDLITYANETNYIVESGAIVPKSTLKVHNNISNVVSLLQKKVSLLESNITRYTITQNRLMLTSRYNADTVGFKVDVATLRNSFEYDNDLYELILNNILVGKDNYDREYIENLIIFYWMDFVISDEMHSALFEIIEEQHNPKVIEDEEAPL